MSKVVTVFGATGLVGSSVAVCLSKQYNVRGVTRDPNSAKAQELKNEGVQLVYTDQMDRRSVHDAINGADACFIQTNSQNGYQAEVAQGKFIADACAQANIKHVIYCTQLSVVKVNGMAAKHMDAKAEVELYMRHDLGLPLTSVIIPCHYESLLMPPLIPKRIENNSYGFEIPMGHTPLHMICTEDMGEITKQIIGNPRTYINRTLSVCGDKLTIKDIAAIFSHHLRPLVFKDKVVTVKQFRESGCAGADDLANMFDFFVRVDQKASIEVTQKLNSSLQTLEQWLCTHKDIAMEAVTSQKPPATGEPPRAF